MSAIIMRAGPENVFPTIGVAGEDLRHGDRLILIPDPDPYAGIDWDVEWDFGIGGTATGPPNVAKPGQMTGKGNESGKSSDFEEISKKEGNHTTETGGPKRSV